MARPRVFISSTYYDLRTVRDDLDRFIRNMGFEPIRHERGHIAYGRDDRPEEYAYREIDLCEILVCIIGGKYGSASSQGIYSITQKELKAAVERGKQVYIFVEDSVQHEYRYYSANKGVSGVKFTAVDNVKIYEFLEEIYALPRGNPIFSFSVSSDITQLLQDQWAGLFQRLLIEHATRSQTGLIEELQRSLQTVGQLVEFLAEQKGKGDQAVQEILFANHPIFEAIRRVTKTSHRIYFTNLAELREWLVNAKRFGEEVEDFRDYPDFFEWRRTSIVDPSGGKETQALYIKKDLFAEDGRLIPKTAAGWNDDWVRFERTPVAIKKKSPPNFSDMDDDIPF